MQFSDRLSVMRRACELAARGLGFVEPNPAVGAVLVDDKLRLVGEGFHQKFGGPHAEVEAIRDAEVRGHSKRLKDATLFVSLEPCCHFGKTPPCTQALVSTGIRHVIIGRADPAPHVNGRGIAELQAAGVEVEVGLLESEAKQLTAPFAKQVTTGLPYVIGKWAMTLDGKLATREGDSKWISNEVSRNVAHQLRGRVDAILVGVGTVRADDPLLTARPPGPRTATRVVLDSLATLPLDCQLVRTLDQAPLLVIAGPDASPENVAALQRAGVDVCQLPSLPDMPESWPLKYRRPDLRELLSELGRRDVTNLLIEGGSAVLGAFADHDLFDEVHVFVAPKLAGGELALSPLSGLGIDEMDEAMELEHLHVQTLDGDIYIHGTVTGHCW